MTNKSRWIRFAPVLLAVSLALPSFGCETAPEPSVSTAGTVGLQDSVEILGGAGSTEHPSLPVSTKSEPAGTTRYACSALTEDKAWALFRAGHTYLDRDEDGTPCEYDPRSEYNTPPEPGCRWVNAYTRKGGVKVRGHWRCR